jgi:UDP-glucuronate 4-epimerase
MTILVTGAAGFIGFHLCMKLLRNGLPVLGLDNVNSYYDQSLKRARIAQLKAVSEYSNNSFSFVEADLENREALEDVFIRKKPRKVVNLAAQAGVRYSIVNPAAYIQSNVVGFGHILDCCRSNDVEHLIYASSSSVYGLNANLPFAESQGVDHPISLYAATKRSNELMAHAYSYLYGVPTTGLRFFTVYGPWGRPDMALFLFTKAILAGEPIQLFNSGHMIRDFTYVDDVIESLTLLIDRPATPDVHFDLSMPKPSTSCAPYRVFNVGNSNPTPLIDYVRAIELAVGREAIISHLPMQPGDVAATASETTALEEWIGYRPNTSIVDGVSKFVAWYRDFYNA